MRICVKVCGDFNESRTLQRYNSMICPPVELATKILRHLFAANYVPLDGSNYCALFGTNRSCARTMEDVLHNPVLKMLPRAGAIKKAHEYPLYMERKQDGDCVIGKATCRFRYGNGGDQVGDANTSAILNARTSAQLKIRTECVRCFPAQRLTARIKPPPVNIELPQPNPSDHDPHPEGFGSQ
jgi:hypothetical protein